MTEVNSPLAPADLKPAYSQEKEARKEIATAMGFSEVPDPEASSYHRHKKFLEEGWSRTLRWLERRRRYVRVTGSVVAPVLEDLSAPESGRVIAEPRSFDKSQFDACSAAKVAWGELLETHAESRLPADLLTEEEKASVERTRIFLGHWKTSGPKKSLASGPA